MVGLCFADIVMNRRLLFLVFDERHHRHHRATQPSSVDEDDDDDGVRPKQGGRAGMSALSCPSSNYNFWMRFACGFWCCMDLLLISIIGFTPYVDNFAHLGGFLYGFLISLSTHTQRHPSPHSPSMLNSAKEDPAGEPDRPTGPFLGKAADCCCCAGKVCRLARARTSLRHLGVVGALSLLVASLVLLRRSDGRTGPCGARCRYVSCIPFPLWTRREDDLWWSCDPCEGVNADIYKRRGDDLYSDLDVYCPQGYTVQLDIFDAGYVTPDEVSADLVDICIYECA